MMATDTKKVRRARSMLDALARMRADESDPLHGTVAGYTYGCRCERCRAAKTADMREYRRRKRRRMDGFKTADEARAAFGERFTYADVGPLDVEALACYVGLECARHSAEGALVRMSLAAGHPRGECVSEDGTTIESAFIRVDGGYFEDREAISFNPDGFIGFAGWADSSNIRPFLRAFARWMSEWMGA